MNVTKSNKLQIKFSLLFFIIGFITYSQEIGKVQSGTNSIKLLKVNNSFSLVYSDINFKNIKGKSTISFPKKETIYKIIMNGFDKMKEHQVFVQTDNNTIVKFEYKKLKRKWMLKIKQNNLARNTYGASSFYSKEEIVQLFGNT